MSPIDDLISVFSTISSYQSDHVSNLLVLDKSLSNELNFITDNKFSSFLKSANISKIIWYDEIGNLDDEDIKSIVFFINLNDNDKGLEKLTSLKSKISNLNIMNSNIHLILSHPLIQFSIDSYLSNVELSNLLTSYHLYNSLLYYEIQPSIYSLELPESGFKDLYLNASPAPIEALAKSLLQLYINSDFKLRITNLYILGELSSKFWEIYEKLKNDYLLNNLKDKELKIIDDIDEMLFLNIHSFYTRSTDLIVLDRSNDLVSCLLSQLSYSGLLNDFFDIETQLKPLTYDDRTIYFNDDIYNDIKDLNFSNVGTKLNKYAKNLQHKFEKFKNLQDLNEIKNFVNDLNSLKLTQSNVTNHTHLVDYILNSENFIDLNKHLDIPVLDELEDTKLDSYFTQLIEFQQDILSNQLSTPTILSKISCFLNTADATLYDIIKLIILTSIVKLGLKTSNFEFLNLELINKFGFETVTPIILNLQKLGIIQFVDLNEIANSHSHSFLSSFQNQNLIESNVQKIENFQTVSKNFNLLPINEDTNGYVVVDDNNTSATPVNADGNDNEEFTKLYNDADFGYPGYVPLFTRLIQSIYDRSFLPTTNTNQPHQHLIKYGWNNLNFENLNVTKTEKFLVPESKKKMFDSIIPPKLSTLSQTANKSIIIITVIGGITWSEISTIKYVLKKNPSTRDKQVTFLTTGMVTGSQILKSLNNVN